MTAPDPNLLAMAAAGRTADVQSALMQQLVGSESLDPAVQTVLTQALAERGESDGEDDTGDDEVALDEDLDRSERRRRATRVLRERFERMQDELDDLRDRNDRLAAALGACPRCWGEDPDCGLCAGRGQSGSYPPDMRLFRELVAPSLRRTQHTRLPSSGAHHGSSPVTGRSQP